MTARRRRVHVRFRTPAGKRRVHDVRASVLSLGRLDVLVADDGVAIRGGDPRFRAPAGSRAWLQRYRSNYEGAYRATRLRAARGAYGFPALISAPDGRWALLTEVGGASHLRARDGGLQATEDGGTWRLALIGDLADVVESSLPLALARPSRIRDTGWIRPGRVAWSWWSDSTSPRRLETQRAYVDAAAERGWEYVLVDEGWDPAWMPELVRYAADRGVRILLWTHWRELRDPARRARLLDRWAGWGVAGVKADFLQSDKPRRIAVYDAIARAAARRRLVVSFHGCTLPRGLQRTWPNVLTMEAVLGAEHRAVAAAHDVNLVFTRNVVGSMDYTPALSASGSTAGHQLALAVAFESGSSTSPTSRRRTRRTRPPTPSCAPCPSRGTTCGCSTAPRTRMLSWRAARARSGGWPASTRAPRRSAPWRSTSSGPAPTGPRSWATTCARRRRQ